MDADGDAPPPPRVHPNPLAKANPISRLFFSWVGPVFRRAYKKQTVTPSDLFEILPEDSSDDLGSRLERNWEREVERKTAAGKRPSLVSAVFRTFGLTYLFYAILFLCEEGLRLSQPLLLKQLTSFFSDENTTLSFRDAYLYAMGLALSGLLLALVHGPNFFGIQRLGMQVRIALCTLMYKKTLKLNNKALGQTTAGQVNNLMTNDVNRFDQLFVYLHYLWLGPLQAIVVLVLLYNEISWASLPGYGVMICLIPINMGLGRLFSRLRRQTAKITDERVGVMTEIITAMRVIKMYAWEKPFGEIVKKLRIKEVQKIIVASYPLAVNMTLGLFGNRLLDVGMIILYTLTPGRDINAATIFVIVSFCNTLRNSFMRMFPRAIQFRSESVVSLNRIETYMLLGEKDVTSTGSSSEGIERDDGIVVENLTCSWEEDRNTTQLSNLSFTIKKGKLLAVIGPVGSGKSSLLMAVLKELPALIGTVKTRGRIAYASQQAWVFGGTVRDNITFGRPFSDIKYRSIIRVCALTKDIEQLPDGDMTLVGERGVTLSGGQKARINLARALYDDADIYLLDDPLSAVDSEVSRHIFEKCVMEYLADKPRILVTHQLQFLNAADQILVLNKRGHMEAVGTLSELHEKGVEFSKLMQKEETEDEGEMEENVEDVPLARLASGSFSRSGSHRSSIKEKKASKTGALFKGETAQKGDISVMTYIRYFTAGGNPFTLFWMLFFVIGAQVVYLMADYWLGYWAVTEEARRSNGTFNGTKESDYPIFDNLNLSTEVSAIVYGALIGGTMLFGLLRAFITFRVMITAARNLHNWMFACVTRAPVLFFDTTPTGRIQNRFTKDIGIMDDQLPLTFFDFLQIALQIAGTILITVILSPWVLIAAVPLLIILILFTRYALVSTTAVKRLDGVARSPVFSHTTGSLQGLWTIRAYKKEQDFIHQFHTYQDHHSEAWFMYIVTNRWFGLRLDLLIATFTAAVSFSCVLLNQYGSGLDAGTVGLILTNCIALGTIFQFCVRQSALVENMMTSVERVIEYTKLDSEAPLDKPDVKPPPGWPPKGAITFDGMSLAYSKDTPRVLKEIDCEINAKEKIGIVGRTGAGKSSLITALFRLAEPMGGLQVDSIQTTELGLHDVRKKISIIPQDPVIFSGTLRRNLDPFEEYSDAVLWGALEDVQLQQMVRENPAKLEMDVGDGGSSFSVGQRQLVCLARAIIKRNRVLILDEATANVDPRTDAVIQETIRTKFRNCTVLTIAHRLHTIMDSDRVMVLDAGELIEFDHPYELLQNFQGTFRKLVDETGRAEASKLGQIALDHYEKMQAAKKMTFEPRDTTCDYLFIILKRSDEGFGFTLRGEYGPVQTPITVAEIMEGTPAAAPGGLRVGDEVLALNDKSRRALSPENITDAFSMDAAQMSLIVRRLQPPTDPLVSSDGLAEDGNGLHHHGNGMLTDGASGLSYQSPYSLYSEVDEDDPAIDIPDTARLLE